MKQSAFNMILTVNKEVCNWNSWHPHDPRKLTCRNNK